MARNHRASARNRLPLTAQSSERLEARLEELLSKQSVREAVEAVMIHGLLEARRDGTMPEPGVARIEMPSPDNLPDAAVAAVLEAHQDKGGTSDGAAG